MVEANGGDIELSGGQSVGNSSTFLQGDGKGGYEMLEAAAKDTINYNGMGSSSTQIQDYLKVPIDVYGGTFNAIGGSSRASGLKGSILNVTGNVPSTNNASVYVAQDSNGNAGTLYMASGVTITTDSNVYVDNAGTIAVTDGSYDNITGSVTVAAGGTINLTGYEYWGGGYYLSRLYISGYLTMNGSYVASVGNTSLGQICSLLSTGGSFNWGVNSAVKIEIAVGSPPVGGWNHQQAALGGGGMFYGPPPISGPSGQTWYDEISNNGLDVW